MSPEERDDARAVALLHDAMRLVGRVRRDDPAVVQADVAALPATVQRDLVILLAALVPAGRPPAQLLEWWTDREAPTPTRPGWRERARAGGHGTAAGLSAHHTNGTEPCGLCRRIIGRDAARRAA